MYSEIVPHSVTADEIPDPQDMALWLEVDGVRYQNGSTRSMIFDVATIVSYLSEFMTLEPGDLIATGTPAGVGLGQKPQVFLKPGQIVRLGGSGLGEQRQKIAPPA